MQQRQTEIAGRAAHYAGSVPSPARAAAPANPAPAVAPVALRADMVAAGMDLALEVINRRDWRPLDQAVADANSSDPNRRRSGLSALYGAAIILAGTLRRVADHGYATITGCIPVRGELEYAFASDPRRFDALLQVMVEAVNELMDKLPGLRASLPERRAETAEPQSVRVVSMPARETATKVRRDAAGDITGSLALEQDTVTK